MKLEELKAAFEYAKDRMNSKRKELNRINVYPVADGDTGTNMSYTISYAIDSASSFLDYGDFFKQVARNVLIGARGNSGSLFSQVIKELCLHVWDKAELSSESLFRAFESANLKMRRILQDPKEGTIITVIKMANEAVSTMKLKDLTVVEFLECYTKEAKKALLKTPDFLSVLKSNGVVDSGAQGFVYFIESLSMALRGEKESLAEEEDAVENHQYGVEDLVFRYCTEFIVKNVSLEPSLLKSYLYSKGDSVIFIEDENLIKVHIHTNFPEEIFRYASNGGELVFTKKQDMQKQVSLNQKVQVYVVGLSRMYYATFEKVGFFNFIDEGDLQKKVETMDETNSLLLPASESALRKVRKMIFPYLETSSRSEILFANNGRLAVDSVEELRDSMNNGFKGVSFEIHASAFGDFLVSLEKTLKEGEVSFMNLYSSRLLEEDEELQIENLIDGKFEFSVSFVEEQIVPYYAVIEL